MILTNRTVVLRMLTPHGSLTYLTESMKKLLMMMIILLEDSMSYEVNKWKLQKTLLYSVISFCFLFLLQLK